MVHGSAFVSTPSSVKTQVIKFLSPRCNIPHRFPISVPLPLASMITKLAYDRSFENNKGIGWKGRACALLWLRVGDLRISDNAAVDFCRRFDGRVLPLLTVVKEEIGNAFLNAVGELRAAFEEIGSALVVKSVSNGQEVATVREVSKIIGAGSVVLNAGSGLGLRGCFALRENGLKVRVCGRDNDHGELFQRPSVFPWLPEMAFQVCSNIGRDGRWGKSGETAARGKLHALLDILDLKLHRCVGLSWLVSRLADELYLGCVSRARVVSEFEKRRGMVSQGRHQFADTMKLLFAKFRSAPAIAALSIAAYDVNGGDRRGVEWDEETKSFRLKEWEHTEKERRMNMEERWDEFWRRRRSFFFRAFFPDDVTPDYYSFTAWRFSQRCVSATIGVFGTSSLLFALGIRSGRIGQAAVISWILKDGLGRVGKMVWAGSMGKDFDVDPKRWRFRSAMLYAIGNGLEIVTQIFPASFLVFATLANSMKQVSMLTSSATRNAMYRSFGDRSQNIANITAKGEAQIVVADLIGMGCGIRLSKIIASSRQNVLGAYLGLTVLDIFGIYMELRQVVFRTLNAERTFLLVNHYLRKGSVMSPSEVSPQERIFLKPRYRYQIRLSSIAKAAKNPDELELLLRVFKREHFLVGPPSTGSSQQCRLVLRKDASNEDVLRAFLMIGYVRRQMRSHAKKKVISLEEQEHILRTASKSSKRNFATFVRAAREAGWSTDNLLFSTMKRRGYWGRERESP